MVLNHVPQRAALVVVAPAALDTKGFGDGDLHVVHVPGVPDRLEDPVRETEDQQVLHGFLAQVVVDAEDLALVKHGRDALVEGTGAGEVHAERFLDHHA